MTTIVWHRRFTGANVRIMLDGPRFNRSILDQIALNQHRTPNERFLALCDLLDVAREMAPQDEESRRRRRLANEAKLREREQWRAELRQLFAGQRANPSMRV